MCGFRRQGRGIAKESIENNGTKKAQKKDGFSANEVRVPSPCRSKEKLHHGKRRHQQAKYDAMKNTRRAFWKNPCNILIAINGKQGQNNAKAKKVDEDNKKNHQKGKLVGFSGGGINLGHECNFLIQQ